MIHMKNRDPPDITPLLSDTSFSTVVFLHLSIPPCRLILTLMKVIHQSLTEKYFPL